MNHKTFLVSGSADDFSFTVTEDLGDKKVSYLWENLTEQELKDIAYPFVTNFYNKVGIAKSQLPNREEERDSLINALQNSVDNYDYRQVYSNANNIEGTYVFDDNGSISVLEFVSGDVIQENGTDIGNYRLYAPNFIAVDLGSGYENYFSSDASTFTDLAGKTLTKGGLTFEEPATDGGNVSFPV